MFKTYQGKRQVDEERSADANFKNSFKPTLLILTQKSAATTLQAFAEHAQNENADGYAETAKCFQVHIQVTTQFRKRAVCTRQEFSQN